MDEGFSIMSMEQKILWTPSAEQITQSNLKKFMDFVESGIHYEDLYDWSIQNPDLFWSAVWDFTGIKSKQKGNAIVTDIDSFEKVKWFSDASLNYAENLLVKRDDDTAIIFRGENKILKKLTWNELYNKVSIVWQMMVNMNVQPGDRIALFVPNMPETVICVLAAASIGAVCSLCSCDFGVQGVVDRFAQIEPKLFIYSDKYLYNGKIIPNQEKVDEILSKLPTVENVLCLPYFLVLDSVVKQKRDADPVLPCEIQFNHLPFNHPLYIMFSSGTTGIPKCIVHGAGGTLIQHLKEHQLHCDMKSGDRVFYYTTCGWMMWQWLVGSLASKCTLLLYDFIQMRNVCLVI
jgi:acetoacetyl-CoA synthetase